MKSSKYTLIAFGVLALVVLAVFLLKRPSEGGAIKIGVIYAGTGPAGFAGRPEREMLEILEKDNNGALWAGKKIVLEMKDSGGDKDQAINFLEQFSNDQQYVAVIGPTTSGESIAVAGKVLELSTEGKLPVLSLAASAKIVQDPKDPNRPNEWAFKFAQGDDLAAQRMARVIKEKLKDGKIGFLYSDDGFGKSGAEVFPVAAKDHSLHLDSLKSFPANLYNPAVVMAGLPKDLKGVVIWGTAPGPALLVKRFRETYPDLLVFLSHGNASKDFIDSLGNRGNGVIVVGSRVLMPRHSLIMDEPRDKAIKQFQIYWEDRTKKPQSHFAGHAYDAFQMLRQVINDGHTDRSSVRSALEKSGSYHGITGTFRFTEHDHAGLELNAFEIYKIRDNEFVPLEREPPTP